MDQSSGSGKKISVFAIEAYKKICDKDNNIICSPFSVASALMLTGLGTAGNTQNQILSCLHMQDAEKPFSDFCQLQESLLLMQEENEMLMANKIFPSMNLRLKQSYKQQIEEHFKTTVVECLNYALDPEGSRKMINSWVEKQTNEKIKDLIPVGVINSLTVNVLANAVYFKGLWANPFDVSKSKTRSFYVSTFSRKPVIMMTYGEKRGFNYGKVSKYNCKIIELPYKGSVISMFVILPKKSNGLQAFEKMLSYDVVNEIKSQMTRQNVQVLFPKFKIESNVDIKSVLIDLGIKDLFLEELANMSNMVEATDDGAKTPYVSDVFHKAFIEVTEEGTEAAAATAMVIRYKGGFRKPPVHKFIADHPFLYFIQDNRTETILFIGRVCLPDG